MFSKACEYGLKASIFIVKQSLEGKRSNLKAISEGIDSPEAFTAKILQKLVKCKIIFSTKGSTGGFEMDDKSIKTISVLNVVEAIDGNGILNNCILGLTNCSSINPCPMHQHYSGLRRNTIVILDSCKIKDLANSLNINKGVLKN